MALFARRPEPDWDALQAEAAARQADAVQTVGRLRFLTESIAERNRRNHYADGLKIALGGTIDGRPAGASG